ncbi:MAG: hypothetical protein Q4F30_07100 [Akkermansia sp.]|nr:hypothetical protein [Akkermansia sp.]
MKRYRCPLPVRLYDAEKKPQSRELRDIELWQLADGHALLIWEAIGRKNCLFIGAPEAGQRSAILYTMMEECKRCKVDSLAWLTWVLDRLPNYRGDYRDLYPSAMPQPQETVKERTV